MIHALAAGSAPAPGLRAVRGWFVLSPLCAGCAPRARFGDGRICRDCAARLGGVLPDTISAWVSRDKKRAQKGEPRRLDVLYEGNRPLFLPAQIIEVEWAKHARERQRLALLASLVSGAESVA